MPKKYLQINFCSRVLNKLELSLPLGLPDDLWNHPGKSSLSPHSSHPSSPGCHLLGGYPSASMFPLLCNFQGRILTVSRSQSFSTSSLLTFGSGNSLLREGGKCAAVLCILCCLGHPWPLSTGRQWHFPPNCDKPLLPDAIGVRGQGKHCFCLRTTALSIIRWRRLC